MFQIRAGLVSAPEMDCFKSQIDHFLEFNDAEKALLAV